LVVIRTYDVFWLFVCIRTVPVGSAVVLIWEKSWSIVLTAYLLVLRVTVWWYCWCRFACVRIITLVTDRSAITAGLVSVVTSIESQVPHHVVPVLIVFAEYVLSLEVSLVTVPIVSTVVLIRKVTCTRICTVMPLLLWSAVR